MPATPATRYETGLWNCCQARPEGSIRHTGDDGETVWIDACAGCLATVEASRRSGVTSRDGSRRMEEAASGVENTVGQMMLPNGSWTDYARATEAEVLRWVAGGNAVGQQRRAVDWITHKPLAYVWNGVS